MGEDTWLKAYDSQTSELAWAAEHIQRTANPWNPCFFLPRRAHRSRNAHSGLGGNLVAVLTGDILELLSGEEGSQPRTRKYLPRRTGSTTACYLLMTTPVASYVTAHNEVVPISMDPCRDSLRNPAPLASPSRPNLYSACLTWLSDDLCSCRGRNCFRRVVVGSTIPPSNVVPYVTSFTYLQAMRAPSSASRFLLMLSLAPGVRKRLLASCSDDRSTPCLGHHRGDGRQHCRQPVAARSVEQGTRDWVWSPLCKLARG